MTVINALFQETYNLRNSNFRRGNFKKMSRFHLALLKLLSTTGLPSFLNSGHSCLGKKCGSSKSQLFLAYDRVKNGKHDKQNQKLFNLWLVKEILVGSRKQNCELSFKELLEEKLLAIISCVRNNNECTLLEKVQNNIFFK